MDSLFDRSEEWRQVVGWEGEYAVSNLGRVRSDRTCRGTRAGRILKPKRCKAGYLHVRLCKNYTHLQQGIHRLVAAAFIGPAQGLQVNHRNGIKDDNRADNLEWVTQSENLRHSARVLGKMPPRGEAHYRASLTDADVERIRLARSSKKFGAVTTIARELGVSRQAAWRAAVNDTWKHMIGTRRQPMPRGNGEKHPGAKLTDEGVRRLIAAKKAGIPLPPIARELGVCPQIAWKAATGKSWAHVHAAGAKTTPQLSPKP